TGVRIPDSHRLGPVGEGWKVARTTLMNERVSIGGSRIPREGGMIGPVARTWRERPGLRTHDLHQRLLTLWVAVSYTHLA
ncbi:acyl-CoA dehydrogenase family protein, partial [Streptomyces sp. DT225]